jgi:hypothetical protein
MREQCNQWSNSAQLPCFGLDGIVHVAEVLEVGRCIGLDHIIGVVEEFNDLVKVRIAPMNTSYACNNMKQIDYKS